MSWKKNRPLNQTKKESDMIEHSISKYKPTIHPVVESVSKYTQSQQWSQARCIIYIEELKKRGFVPGKQVQTKWGIEGCIEPYTPIPSNGLYFYGKSCPDIIRIKMNQYGNCMSYNEDEVTLTKKEWEMIC